MDDVIREFRVRPVIVPMSEAHRWNACWPSRCASSEDARASTGCRAAACRGTRRLSHASPS